MSNPMPCSFAGFGAFLAISIEVIKFGMFVIANKKQMLERQMARMCSIGVQRSHAVFYEMPTGFAGSLDLLVLFPHCTRLLVATNRRILQRVLRRICSRHRALSSLCAVVRTNSAPSLK